MTVFRCLQRSYQSITPIRKFDTMSTVSFSNSNTNTNYISSHFQFLGGVSSNFPQIATCNLISDFGIFNPHWQLLLIDHCFLFFLSSAQPYMNNNNILFLPSSVRGTFQFSAHNRVGKVIFPFI